MAALLNQSTNHFIHTTVGLAFRATRAFLGAPTTAFGAELLRGVCGFANLLQPLLICSPFSFSFS